MKISTYEDKGVACAQYFLLFFNLMLWVVGGIMFGLGIYFHVHHDVYSTLTSETYFIGANLLIAGGVLLIVGGFFGCCSTLWDNQLALIGFIFYLVICLSLEIATAVFGYQGTPSLQAIALKHMTQDVDTKYHTMKNVRDAMDRLQSTRHCCGYNGYQNWAASTWAKNGTADGKLKGPYPVPASCCNTTMVKSNSPAACTKLYDYGKNTQYIYTQGCFPRYKDDIVMFMYSIGAFGIGVSLFQILGIILAFVLFFSLSSTQGYKYI
ncbi:uncharacterized protein TRIADDRAFT_58643 [Trichoplax adhaerens]|uniref:Tetraspanin n=1 Tax=Trichoplax adhaerens TaxID=10228 RepID=B3S398_TRIAD|nr:hypothetical protein TRIADDRAFT_58643 [Trichoplax adhaerens]EDV22933.1 hypothetical protein TRIADDRAFT_58643 [Trichoplax adhaerens]|eukprot:XP_002114799.1 hypothetical protein TRIADDRAFT_58643 [Trichoplax adhaerens]